MASSYAAVIMSTNTVPGISPHRNEGGDRGG